ncbi:MAG: RrF2 family transcriptional regulator [Spirochaetaceae bacterium]|jgi:Rrf2 family iron-sulfur cluster assembly transcriptional regulator|nr:RrF2 family transcriptional regulator [Spirochaetaceae bacterium]
MRITTRGRYALRAILAMVSLGSDGSPVSISSLSEREEISPVFLEQIFFRLRKAGIVSSVRGPGGGFCLARPLSDLTIKNILDAAGENLACTFCKKSAPDCPRKSYCLSHPILVEVSNLVNNYLGTVTLESVLENQNILDEVQTTVQV